MLYGIRHTEHAKAWLKQFDYDDRSTAATLIDGLLLISHDEFRIQLKGVLDRIAVARMEPTAFFVAREEERGQEYFSGEEPNLRPNAVRQGSGVGSEGPLAHLIRDVCRSNRLLLDHPSIDELRMKKVNRLVIVDDIVGSGKRAVTFIKWLSRHRSLRSWLSSGHVRFEVGAFATTPSGRGLLESIQGVASVQSARVAHYGRTKWTFRQREAVEVLCKKYSPRTGWKKWPVGYEDAMTMFVFQHGCPNTAPPILWRRCESNKWKPLFDGRPEFTFTTWPTPLDGSERAQLTLGSLGLSKSRDLQWLQHMAPQARTRLVLLAALCRRRHSIDVLSDIAEVSIEECEELVRECEEFGWVNEYLRITSRGLQELRRARSLDLVGESTRGLTDSVYVPQSFRGG